MAKQAYTKTIWEWLDCIYPEAHSRYVFMVYKLSLKMKWMGFDFRTVGISVVYCGLCERPLIIQSMLYVLKLTCLEFRGQGQTSL